MADKTLFQKLLDGELPSTKVYVDERCGAFRDIQPQGPVHVLVVPREPLPFPSLVAASRDDPLGGRERVAGLARDWGARLVDLGHVGHLNPASGYGHWGRAQEFVDALCA